MFTKESGAGGHYNVAAPSVIRSFTFDWFKKLVEAHDQVNINEL